MLARGNPDDAITFNWWPAASRRIGSKSKSESASGQAGSREGLGAILTAGAQGQKEKAAEAASTYIKIRSRSAALHRCPMDRDDRAYRRRPERSNPVGSRSRCVRHRRSSRSNVDIAGGDSSRGSRAAGDNRSRNRRLAPARQRSFQLPSPR